MHNTYIFKIGEIYKGAEIVEVGHIYASNQTLYTFKCSKCGKIAQRRHSDFVKKPFCKDCLKANTESKKIDKVNEDYVGKTINGIKILSVSQRDNKGCLCVNVLCPRCKKEFVTTLTRVKIGINSCKDCLKTNLDLGHDFVKNAAVDGTLISAIDGRRAINKNNTTGYNGVNVTKSGRYRAYINFKRKQYHLGVYDTAKEAAEARKIAENKIYGDFLKWYAETYPEKWEKLNKCKD